MRILFFKKSCIFCLFIFSSVAGMVASHDANAFCYSIGRRSQDETITTFQSNFMENLKLFRQKNNRLPIKLIYFRQDESGSPSRDTIESERKAMLRACREIDEGHDVQITIIIVEQEAHMRLFSLNSNAQVAAKSTNVPPGTVIDTFMTNRHQRTFYMVSQKAVEGVTRPTKYRIFLDEANHCIYDLQELIFFVSFALQLKLSNAFCTVEFKNQIQLLIDIIDFCIISVVPYVCTV